MIDVAEVVKEDVDRVSQKGSRFFRTEGVGVVAAGMTPSGALCLLLLSQPKSKPSLLDLFSLMAVARCQMLRQVWASCSSRGLKMRVLSSANWDMR